MNVISAWATGALLENILLLFFVALVKYCLNVSLLPNVTPRQLTELSILMMLWTHLILVVGARRRLSSNGNMIVCVLLLLDFIFHFRRKCWCVCIDKFGLSTIERDDLAAAYRAVTSANRAISVSLNVGMSVTKIACKMSEKHPSVPDPPEFRLS